jgi:hypothetical protein
MTSKVLPPRFLSSLRVLFRTKVRRCDQVAALDLRFHNVTCVFELPRNPAAYVTEYAAGPKAAADGTFTCSRQITW